MTYRNRVLAGCLVATLAWGCDALRDSVGGDFVRTDASVVTLRAPTPDEDADLDLYYEWRSARVSQRLAARHRAWAFRPFTEFVVLNGVGHRALLLLPSRGGAASSASFKVDVPADSDVEVVAWVALFPKFAAESDGVEFGWAVGDGSADPNQLPIRFEHLAGGTPPTQWREIRLDLAAFRGRTVWVVLASRDTGNRRADWLLWGDPRVRAKGRSEPVVVDLSRPETLPRRPRAVPWSAATVFKPYSLFGASGAHYGRAAWLGEAYPWLTTLRFLSALGGNHGPTLAAQDAQGAPTTQGWEVGVAAQYEFFHDRGDPQAPIASQMDWQAFDALNASAAASGLDLHLNLAAAPERFTGGTGNYSTYRFNESPVTDAPAWTEYVGDLFGHLAAQPWYRRAAFSFFSEPNCIWVEANGDVRKIGYQGDAEQYARQYLATWRGMKPSIGTAPVYLGPWVVEAERGPVDNLREYLDAIVHTFDAAHEPLPPWAAFSFNLYETPQMTLDHFVDHKIDHARRVLADALPRPALPLRIDELGVHPMLAAAFQETTGVGLGTTRWEMAWHAEASALLLDEGIVQAASWYPILMVYPPHQSLRAYASYFFLSAVVGAVDWAATADGKLTVTRAAGDRPVPTDVGVRLGSRHEDRIGVVTAADPATGTRRLAAWSYPRFAATDEQVAVGARGEALAVILPPRDDRPWHVRILGYDDQAPLPPDAGIVERRLVHATFDGLPPFLVRELEARDRVILTLDPGTLYLVEAE